MGSDKSFLEIFEISPFSGQNRVNWRGRGRSRFFPQIEIFQLLLLGSPCKNLEPYDKPFWDIFEISPFSGQNRVKWGEVWVWVRVVRVRVRGEVRVWVRVR